MTNNFLELVGPLQPPIPSLVDLGVPLREPRCCFVSEETFKQFVSTLLEHLRFSQGALLIASFHNADVAELADALDSKSSTGNSVWVRPPPSAGSPPLMRFLMNCLCSTRTFKRKPF